LGNANRGSICGEAAVGSFFVKIIPVLVFVSTMSIFSCVIMT